MKPRKATLLVTGEDAVKTYEEFRSGSASAYTEEISRKLYELYRKTIEELSIPVSLNDSFWRWFGNSHVANGNGDPLVVYHGTSYQDKFYEFKRNQISWFTETMEFALHFAIPKPNFSLLLYTVFLSIQNPVYVPIHADENLSYRKLAQAIGFPWENSRKYDYVCNYINSPGFVESAQEYGYDGVFMDQVGENTWGTFFPEQIKHIYNRGTWSRTDPDIRHNPYRRNW